MAKAISDRGIHKDTTSQFQKLIVSNARSNKDANQRS
jgi:hypothetical protein